MLPRADTYRHRPDKMVSGLTVLLSYCPKQGGCVQVHLLGVIPEMLYQVMPQSYLGIVLDKH